MGSDSQKRAKERYEMLREELAERGVDVEEVKENLKRFGVEVPSWVFGEFGGGRFADYVPAAPARDRFEKIDEAGFDPRTAGS